ncbi:hypothetical protein V8G54_026290 [Vigna mungo]|uniref:Uncharacterized protein n=1 Tax=Vigna mungo TaxID=3915 RepID=A0AAQ3N054_VIGMU
MWDLQFMLCTIIFIHVVCGFMLLLEAGHLKFARLENDVLIIVNRKVSAKRNHRKSNEIRGKENKERITDPVSLKSRKKQKKEAYCLELSSLRDPNALDIVNEMCEAGLTLSTEVLHSMLQICDETSEYNLKNIIDGVRVLEHMPCADIKPDS